MTETYKKLNDYTLEVVQPLSDAYLSAGTFKTPGDYRLTRIFNFGTGQITTLARHFSIVASNEYSSHTSSGVAAAVQMSVQNFADLPAKYELEIMHRKLIELEGAPPPLETLLAEKKPVSGKPRLGAPAR